MNEFFRIPALSLVSSVRAQSFEEIAKHVADELKLRFFPDEDVLVVLPTHKYASVL